MAEKERGGSEKDGDSELTLRKAYEIMILKCLRAGEMKQKGGYTKRYYLRRVRRVNEVYLEHAQRGIPTARIYRNYIKDEFNISRSTFYSYLSVPYKKELEELGGNTKDDCFKGFKDEIK